VYTEYQKRASRPDLGPTHCLIQWELGELYGRKPDHSPPSSADVSNVCICICLLLYAFVACAGTNVLYVSTEI
jgi:hypothetical protein